MTQNKIFDELLVIRCKEGDPKAFELLVKRWSKKLMSFAYKYTKSVDAAKDIVQESWISIHKGIFTLQDVSKFASWAFRITYNKSIDHLRKQKRQELTEVAIDIESNDEDQWPTVESLLQKMPAQHKLILTLFYLEQQSIKQIASILKLPEGTVKSRVFYARELLKRNYKEVNHEKY